jgi:hypothetical protein
MLTVITTKVTVLVKIGLTPVKKAKHKDSFCI